MVNRPGSRAGSRSPTSRREHLDQVEVAPGDGGRVCMVSNVPATYEVHLNSIS
ncbi:MAG: hypothetical protein R2715_09345 [Ilumatobacteraceae bacterium]